MVLKGKARAQQRHAKRRAVQRLGVPVGDHTLAQIVSQIQRGEAKYIRTVSNRVTVFEVEIHGLPANVYYDNLRKQVATIVNPREDTDGVAAG